MRLGHALLPAWPGGRLRRGRAVGPRTRGGRARSSASANRSTASRIGQRVSIEPQRPDPDSEETRRGHYNLCPHMRFFATPPVDGAFCDYVTIGAAFAHPVPDSMSDDAAALCEPLSVGIAAIRKAGVDGGSRVLIAGAGPIGIVVAQLARAYGATEIVVSDPDQTRRDAGHGVRRDNGARPHRRRRRRPRRSTRSSTLRVRRRPSPTASARCGRRARWCWSARAPNRWSCRRS